MRKSADKRRREEAQASEILPRAVPQLPPLWPQSDEPQPQTPMFDDEAILAYHRAQREGAAHGAINEIRGTAEAAEEQCSAATQMQPSNRGSLDAGDTTKASRLQEKQHTAATQLQALARGWWGRRNAAQAMELMRQHHVAATQLQAMMRGAMSRQKAELGRQHTTATETQARVHAQDMGDEAVEAAALTCGRQRAATRHQALRQEGIAHREATELVQDRQCNRHHQHQRQLQQMFNGLTLLPKAPGTCTAQHSQHQAVRTFRNQL